MGKFIVSALRTLIGVMSALSLGIAGFWVGHWWDSRPAGQPAWAQGHFLWWKWAPPLSLAAQRDAAAHEVVVYQTAESAARVHAATVQRQQAAVTASAAGAETKAQAAIQIHYRNILQKVPVYVTAQADADCTVPSGFVRLHDAAARGFDLSAIPGAPSQPYDAASGVKLSAVAGTVVANYGAAAANAEQLTALQAWVVAQRKAAQ